MISFCAIPPTAHLAAFQQRYHLALAPRCLVDKRYFDFYKQRAAAGDYVILDNGAYEIGCSLNPRLVLRLAIDGGFREVVLPDVLRDAAGTFQALTAVGELLRQTARDHPELSFMVVPQGTNADEWMQSCEDVVKLCEYYYVSSSRITIGIPKHAATFAGQVLGRMYLLRRLQRWFGGIHAIHLLGLDDQMREILFLMTIPELRYQVRSIDSSKPIIHALNGDRLRTNYAWIAGPVYHRPQDYFSAKLNASTLDLARHNVRVVRMVLDGHKVLP
jgi:hypothetical protein